MKKLCGVVCFLIGLWSPPYAVCRDPVSPCRGFFADESGLMDIMPLERFILVLADLKIYSTADFVIMKKQAGLPEGISDKPLRVYQELQGEWGNLWDKVNEIRLSREIPEDKAPTPFFGKKEKANSGVHSGKQEPNRLSRTVNNNSKGRNYRFEAGKSAGKSGTSARILGNSRRWSASSRYNPQEKRKEQILALIAENRNITTLKLAEKTGLSIGKIEGTIAGLKREGRLARVGPNNRYGYWEILEEGASPSHYKSQEERKEQILALIAENKYITLPQLAAKTGLSRKTIIRRISSLKREGQLARVGGGPHGYWEILEEGASPSRYNPPVEREEKILAFIAENRSLTLPQLAAKIGLSIGKIRGAIASMKREGRLARVGSNSRYGYWEILEDEASP